jgi:putative intracellular protease/amidase
VPDEAPFGKRDARLPFPRQLLRATTSTTTGWPVGFWASELTHPYDAFVRAGYDVTIASPDGGQVELDAMSDPRDASGYSKDDVLSADSLERPAFRALLENTPAVGDLNPNEYDAIVVCGGQAPMFNFAGATSLHRTFVRGRKITGFANSEEDFADQAVGQKLTPFRIEDQARKLGAQFVTAEAFAPFATSDGLLITGQQQHSGAAVAKLVIEALDG